MSKQITVNVPDNVSYKKAKEAGLGGAKSLSVPQAQGGDYRVAVGGTLNESETSMGRLASSLKGINNALGAYADIAVRREERSIDELRRMSNEKKRELIGAENKVFRKMGIRPQSILQVKQSLGTAETGRFQAEWQEHLDNVLIPSQSEAGDPLTASQIQQEYTKYRQGWAKDNEFLSKSQLATDGFLAETDGLYDRNSAYYFKSADGYYEQNVQRFSAAEALWAVAGTSPELIISQAKTQIDSMNPSTFYKVLEDLNAKVIASGSVSEIEKMQTVIRTMGDAKHGLKIGSQLFGDTMSFDLLNLQVEKAKTDARLKPLREDKELYELKVAEIQSELNAAFAQRRVDIKNATSPEHEEQIRDEFYQTKIVPNFDVLGQGMALRMEENLEKELNTLNGIRRTEQTRQDTEITTSILKPIHDAVHGFKPIEEINAIVEEQKKVAQESFDSEGISKKAYQDLSGKLHSLGLKTTHDTMQAAKGRELSNEGQLIPTLEAARIGNEHYAIINEVKESLVDVNGKPLGERRIAKYLETSVMGNTSGYEYNEQRLNRGTKSILTKHTVDIAEKRLEISQQVFSEMSPQRNGVIGPEMLAERDKRLAAYVEARTKQTVKELINFSNEGEQAAREQELLSAGYNLTELSEAEVNDRYLQLKQWERSVEDGNDGMFVTSQDYRTGEIDIKIGADWAFDLDDTQPFTGRHSNRHTQFEQRYEKLHESEVIGTGTGQDKKTITPFDAVKDETKARLSARYRESLFLIDMFTGERKIDSLVKDLDRGERKRPSGPASNPYLVVKPQDPVTYAEQTYEGRRKAEQKLFTAYELAGVPTEHWRDQGYKDGNSEFTLRGAFGDVKSGIGYQKRKDLAFVPVETIQKLHDFVSSNQAAGNITADLQTALQNLPKEDIAVVKEALSAFYITGEKSAESALQELYNNHRAIYSVKQGYNFYK